jgi:hypothetical protein
MKKLLLGLIISSFIGYTIAFAGNPAAYACIKSDVLSYLDSNGYHNASIQLRCYGKSKELGYRLKSWDHGSNRMHNDNWAYTTGSAVSKDTIDMCGNPCKQ